MYVCKYFYVNFFISSSNFPTFYNQESSAIAKETARCFVRLQLRLGMTTATGNASRAVYKLQITITT